MVERRARPGVDADGPRRLRALPAGRRAQVSERAPLDDPRRGQLPGQLRALSPGLAERAAELRAAARRRLRRAEGRQLGERRDRRHDLLGGHHRHPRIPARDAPAERRAAAPGLLRLQPLLRALSEPRREALCAEHLRHQRHRHAERQLAGVYGARGRTPKLWLSEFGISTRANGFFDIIYVAPPVQARWVGAAFRLVDPRPMSRRSAGTASSTSRSLRGARSARA